MSDIVRSPIHPKIIPLKVVAAEYSRFWNEGSAIFQKHNPCNIHLNEKGEVKCFAGNPCCTGCKHLGPKGCKVQALSCKVWTCHILQKESKGLFKEFFRDLVELKKRIAASPFSWLTGFVRSSKNEVMLMARANNLRQRLNEVQRCSNESRKRRRDLW